ncbi:TPA: type I restriction-modification system subunit M N-terminal domain-containing protein [Neisseria meningitidis]|uniref:type I restriction-modification system subunit M N-terminal domain-containing protein n=1 Tax=Neisseria meningitidis TaxID=487 RepID=UPI0035F75B9F
MRAFIKNYVLTLLFLKYVSDKHKYGGGMIELHAGTTFDDIVKLKNTADIGDRLNKIIAQIAEANDLKGVIDVTDFNDEDKLGSRPAPAFMTRPAARVRCCSKPPPKPAAKSAFTVRKKMWQPRPLPV